MDRSVPAPAAKLLKFIMHTEAPQGYETIYGNNQDKLKKPLTKMTLDEVEAAGPTWTRRFGSSACGAYQFMRDTLDKPGTLADIEGQMGLTGKELMTPDLQDRMGFHLLGRRGYEKFMAGTLSTVLFARNLAQEWASFPVIVDCKGAHRKVMRGQSYYAGDGVNKALVKPEAIEELLAEVKAMGTEDAPKPAPRPAKPEAIEDEPQADRPEGITDYDTVFHVQTRLRELGYSEVGNPDGKMGKLTRTAVLAFRNENDLPLSPEIDDEFLAALAQAKPRVLAVERVEATPTDVRNQVPEVKANWWSKIWAWVLGIPAFIGATADGIIGNIPGARETLRPFQEFAADVPKWVWFVAVGGLAFIILRNATKGEKKGIEAFQSGERR